MFKQRRSLNAKTENSWNSSRRIFLHVGCDVASFLLPSKALLCCYLCPASSLSLGGLRFGRSRDTVPIPEGLGVCVAPGGRAHGVGWRGQTTPQAGGQPRGRGNLVEIGAREGVFSRTFS